MSVFDDSEESEAGSVKRKQITDEVWGDDVSVISRYEGPSPSVIIFKFILALILIGACSGALVYSIINSEEEVKNEHTYEPPENFPIDNNQACSAGSLTIYKENTNGEIYMDGNITTNWIQDATKKRIYHRVGLKDSDWQYSYYVFETVTFYQNKTGCYNENKTYSDFLSGMGLEYVNKAYTVKMIIQGDYTETEVYEGEPPTDTIVNGAHPSLIRGYASMTEPMVYGWAQYFARNEYVNTSIARMEYFFPTMKSEEPDYSVFDSLPNACYQ